MESHVHHPSSNDVVVVNINGDSDSDARSLHPTDRAFSPQQQQQQKVGCAFTVTSASTTNIQFDEQQ